MFSKEMNKMQS